MLLLRDLVLPLFGGFVGAWLLVYLKGRTAYTKAYRAFFHEVEQNISHALHNIQIIEKSEERQRLVTFRDDIWIWSKKTGYFTKFPKELQKRFFDLYLKQYDIGEFIVRYRNGSDGNSQEVILKETKNELLQMLKQAKKELESKIDP